MFGKPYRQFIFGPLEILIVVLLVGLMVTIARLPIMIRAIGQLLLNVRNAIIRALFKDK